MSKLNISIDTLPKNKYEKATQPHMINYGFHSSKFGNCVVGMTEDKICYLAFTHNKEMGVDEIQHLWPAANLVQDQAKTDKVLDYLFNDSTESDSKISLLLKGTPFQIKVWKALAFIPFGAKVSYESIAEKIGNIKAVRAVASAVARNNVSYIIPCHRVIRKSGQIHKYRWGADIKKAILEWEEGFAISPA